MVGNVACINLPHTVPQELVNLKGVGENSVAFWAGAPQPSDGWNEAALEGFEHTTMRILLSMLLCFSLLVALVHVELQEVVPKGIVALADQLKEETYAVARAVTRGEPLSELLGSARWKLLAFKSNGQGVWARCLPASEFANCLDCLATLLLETEWGVL